MLTVEELLPQLGAQLGLPPGLTLSLGEHKTCLLELEEGLLMNLEEAPFEGYLLVSIQLGSISPGRGRELLFRAMLKSSATLAPYRGRFGYAKTADQAVLFEYFDLTLSPEVISDHVLRLIDKGRKWQKAIQTGEIPTV